jgi:hypothetical protein
MSSGFFTLTGKAIDWGMKKAAKAKSKKLFGGSRGSSTTAGGGGGAFAANHAHMDAQLAQLEHLERLRRESEAIRHSAAAAQAIRGSAAQRPHAGAHSGADFRRQVLALPSPPRSANWNIHRQIRALPSPPRTTVVRR